MDKVKEALEDSPASALILNTPSTERLWQLIQLAQQSLDDTPIIGAAAAAPRRQYNSVSLQRYLIKPVKREDLVRGIKDAPGPVQRILLIDDDPDFGFLMGRTLQAVDDAIEIVSTLNATDGLQAMRDHQPDLVLLDVILPEMTGWDVLALKEQDATIRDIPVILVSAQDPDLEPMRSSMIVATSEHGLSVPSLIQCSLALSHLMLSKS